MWVRFVLIRKILLIRSFDNKFRLFAMIHFIMKFYRYNYYILLKQTEIVFISYAPLHFGCCTFEVVTNERTLCHYQRLGAYLRLTDYGVTCVVYVISFAFLLRYPISIRWCACERLSCFQPESLKRTIPRHVHHLVDGMQLKCAYMVCNHTRFGIFYQLHLTLYYAC